VSTAGAGTGRPVDDRKGQIALCLQKSLRHLEVSLYDFLRGRQSWQGRELPVEIAESETRRDEFDLVIQGGQRLLDVPQRHDPLIGQLIGEFEIVGHAWASLV